MRDYYWGWMTPKWLEYRVKQDASSAGLDGDLAVGVIAKPVRGKEAEQHPNTLKVSMFPYMTDDPLAPLVKVLEAFPLAAPVETIESGSRARTHYPDGRRRAPDHNPLRPQVIAYVKRSHPDPAYTSAPVAT